MSTKTQNSNNTDLNSKKRRISSGAFTYIEKGHAGYPEEIYQSSEMAMY